MDELNKPYKSAVYDLAVQKAIREAQDSGRAPPSEVELDAIGKHADALNVYGHDAKFVNGKWIEQGIGSPGHENVNHFNSIRRYSGEQAYQAAIREIYRRDPKRAAALGLPQPARA
jgi:hypothetical protein